MHLLILAVSFGPLVVTIGENVVDVDDTTLHYRPAGCRPSVARNRILFCNFKKFLRCPAAGSHPVDITVLAEDETPVGAAEAHCMFEQTLQHRFQLEGGAPDDLEHLACRDLRFARLA